MADVDADFRIYRRHDRRMFPCVLPGEAGSPVGTGAVGGAFTDENGGGPESACEKRRRDARRLARPRGGRGLRSLEVFQQLPRLP